MSEPRHSWVGRVLADAVPPLPEPPDRVGAVRARVRRARIRTAATTCAAVALVAGVALAVSARPADAPAPVATGLDAGSCPAFVDLPSGDEERPGPLVPDGATEAMLCEVTRADHLVGHQVLRAEIEDVVEVLNALPAKDELGSARERENLGQPGLGCNLANYYEQYSLVLRYPDGTTVTVLYDRNCNRSVVPEGAIRYGNALCEFRRLYHEQVAATVPLPQPWPPCE